MRNTWIWATMLAVPMAFGTMGCGEAEKSEKSAEGKGGKGEVSLPTAEKPIDQSYIIDEFVVAVVLHPSRVLNSKPVKDLIAQQNEEEPGKLDDGLKLLKDRFGVEPDKIEQAIVLFDGTYVASLPAVMFTREPPTTLPGVIIRYSGTLDEAKLLPALSKAVLAKSGGGSKDPTPPTPKKNSNDGMPYYTWENSGDAAAFVNGNTLIAAPEATLKKMLAAKKPTSPLAKRLTTLGAEHDLVIVAAGTQIEQMIGMIGGNLGKDGEKYTPLLKKLKSIAITLSASSNPMVSVVLGMQDAAAATELATLINAEGMTKLKEAYQANKRTLSGEKGQAADELMESLAAGAIGNDVIISVNRPSGIDNISELLELSRKKSKSSND